MKSAALFLLCASVVSSYESYAQECPLDDRDPVDLVSHPDLIGEHPVVGVSDASNCACLCRNIMRVDKADNNRCKYFWFQFGRKLANFGDTETEQPSCVIGTPGCLKEVLYVDDKCSGGECDKTIGKGYRTIGTGVFEVGEGAGIVDPATDLAACTAACDSDFTCVAFSFDLADTQCVLVKNTVNQPITLPPVTGAAGTAYVSCGSVAPQHIIVRADDQCKDPYLSGPPPMATGSFGRVTCNEGGNITSSVAECTDDTCTDCKQDFQNFGPPNSNQCVSVSPGSSNLFAKFYGECPKYGSEQSRCYLYSALPQKKVEPAWKDGVGGSPTKVCTKRCCERTFYPEDVNEDDANYIGY